MLPWPSWQLRLVSWRLVKQVTSLEQLGTSLEVNLMEATSHLRMESLRLETRPWTSNNTSTCSKHKWMVILEIQRQIRKMQKRQKNQNRWKQVQLKQKARQKNLQKLLLKTTQTIHLLKQNPP